ncbi:TolC family protein [Albibacterium sp.]|uniref:TolC family protein n=1 Tax=Albibacterium sp. TaxID=2952885 RepID=UPI002B528596|nr:TolC family protein [Albibacterium sp.]HUH18663.1 TolC family protein [Albibacterium sp.]
MKTIKIANKQIESSLLKNTIQLLKRAGITLILLSFFTYSQAQEKVLTLNEAIQLGLENSKQLKLSQSRVNEAISQYNQVKDKALPTASTSFAYNHTEILNDQFQIGNEEAFDLPARTNAFIGTASIQQLIFQGNKLKFAKESTNLLTQVARLDIDKNKQDIIYNIINAYYNLYKVLQSEKVVEQNLRVIDRQIKQSERFFEQGIVTKNDVLRFQLEKSNIQLTGLDLENNRKVVNYNLDILLGLPESTILIINKIADDQTIIVGLPNYIDNALNNREELKQISLQTQVADYNIKSAKADLLPTLGVGANMYFINPSGKFIPPVNQSLAPVSIAATLTWNLSNLWTNKNKVAEARIKKEEIQINEGIFQDQIKTQVNQDYQNYLKSVERIKILQTSITQAQENDKILESKYENTIASVTDRIDANNQLFQSQINLELAKADAILAYYTLLKSTATLK